MRPNLKPGLAQIALEKRDELALRFLQQRNTSSRRTWIDKAKIQNELSISLQNDPNFKAKMLEEATQRGAAFAFMEPLLRAYENGAEEAKALVLELSKLFDRFYSNMADAALKNRINPAATNAIQVFDQQIIELAQGLAVFNQLAAQNLKNFDFNETNEINLENEQSFDRDAPSFNPRPTFTPSSMKKEVAELAVLEKLAAKEKIAENILEKTAELGMHLIARA